LLYPEKCYSFSLLIFLVGSYRHVFALSWGKFRSEPATRWFDESFAPILKSGGNDLHVSSAQRKLPSSFHLTLPCSSIAHHLSGFNRIVQMLDFSFEFFFFLYKYIKKKSIVDAFFHTKEAAILNQPIMQHNLLKFGMLLIYFYFVAFAMPCEFILLLFICSSLRLTNQLISLVRVPRRVEH